MQTCKDADMVVDHMLLLFSHEQIAMQEAGSRILLVVEPVEILERLFPTAEMRARVEAASGDSPRRSGSASPTMPART
ncbi:2,5-dihydroxypyridine 5,6-dioxygenase [Geodia barretti]|uniref:2,5-dihydroxypyridine 5,6-dioxygenase n=1 Tax=Geodia barretti TaxID=519541 RepID=A0AA35TRL0_GEOBA|nr:2,5-dihydroxypyridine 5,6-dioxygenase [Geodia barretti]